MTDILGHDPAAVGGVLAGIAEATRELDSLLGNLSPKVDAALFYLRSADPNVFVPDGPTFSHRNSELHNLALISDRMANDIARGDGQPSEFARDPAIELELNERQDAGVYDLRISDGNKSRFPH